MIIIGMVKAVFQEPMAFISRADCCAALFLSAVRTHCLFIHTCFKRRFSHYFITQLRTSILNPGK
jgi:hypothetical protein